MSAKPRAASPFLDTNVLVYALAWDDPRAATARSLLLAGGVVSVQVLGEFVAIARDRLDMDWSEIEEALSAITVLCGTPRPVTMATQQAALALAREHGLGFDDATIVAAAAEAECPLLYSESLPDGLVLNGLTVRDPFGVAEPVRRPTARRKA
jgi:predicted nucleic acid-binding protein